MWNYSQTLQNANQYNIATTKDHIQLLTQQLDATIQQRNNLTDKLKLAMNSKELLVKLHQELSTYKVKLGKLIQSQYNY